MLVVQIFGDAVVAPGAAAQGIGRGQAIEETAAGTGGTGLVDQES